MRRVHSTFAIAVVAAAIATAATLRGQARPEVALRAAIELEEVKGDVTGAVEQYKRLADSRDRSIAAQALLRLAGAYQALGDVQARAAYERIVRDFADQADVAARAQRGLRALGAPAAATSQTARRIVPIWTGEGVGYGRPSLDGRYVAFHVGSTGDLAVRDLVSNTTRYLTNTGGWVASGDYVDDWLLSPDGRFVAYSWFIEDEGLYELRVISTAGDARPRTIVRPPKNEWVGPAAWTPDGTRLVVKREPERGVWQLGIVAISDGSYTSLKSLDWRNPGGVTSLSPDGRYFAYAAQFPNNGSPRDILVLALDGSQESVALPGPDDDFNPFWSPDGTHLVFMSNRGGSNGVWSMPMRDGRAMGIPTLVKADVGAIRPLGLTRNGSFYYGAAGTPKQNVYTVRLKDGTSIGEPARIPSMSTDANVGPAWSPDGAHLAYYSRKQHPSLIVRSMRTGQERSMVLPQGLLNPFSSGPKWFPDGRAVLILSRDPEGTGLAFYRFDIETGESEAVYRLRRNPSSFALAPDGSALFLSIQSTGDQSSTAAPSGRIVRFDLKTRQEQELARDRWFIALAISPNGSTLAYLASLRERGMRTEAPSVLGVIPAMGGLAREVFRDRIWYSGSRYNTLTWTPDGHSLLAVRDDGALWRIPVDGATPQKVGVAGTSQDLAPGVRQPAPAVERDIKSPSVHPDGTMLAFSMTEGSGNEIWALENFLLTPGK